MHHFKLFSDSINYCARSIQTQPHFICLRFARGPSGPPMDGIKAPAARAAPPAPRASHVPAQHVPPAARSLPPSRTLTKLGHLPYGPTTPSTRRSLDQFGRGPNACSTRISPAHKTSNRLRPRTSSWKSSQTGCSGTLQKPMVTKSY